MGMGGQRHAQGLLYYGKILSFLAALLNKLSQGCTDLTCIWDACGSNFGCDTTILHKVSHSPSDNCQVSSLIASCSVYKYKQLRKEGTNRWVIGSVYLHPH
jgi:hypothetical protein